MSKLRPECVTGTSPAIPTPTALFLIRDAVERRKGLIYGQLDDYKGRHCAMGCFWADNPKLPVDQALVDEVAAVNDSLGPCATPKQRWLKVRNWLRFKLKTLTNS
jgi:hypothetical protein